MKNNILTLTVRRDYWYWLNNEGSIHNSRKPAMVDIEYHLDSWELDNYVFFEIERVSKEL